ncbi:hypothetical protein X798_07154, partial [Onchocerca flexuosa]
MIQMHYSFLFVILHVTSISTFSFTRSKREGTEKILELQQNNLTTTMATVNETTSATEKMITELTKIFPSWMPFMSDLEKSENLETKIKNLEIFGTNASASTDTKKVSKNAVSVNIHPSMNASEVLESTQPSMNESAIPENPTTSASKFETEAIKDNQEVLEADVEGLSTNPVSGNTHPSMSTSEAFDFKEPNNTHPSMNAPEIPENIHPSVNASEVLENTIPTISAIDTSAFKNNGKTIEEITTTLPEETTLEQTESTLSSTLKQTESTLSSTLKQTESTSFSTVNVAAQLPNTTRGRAISSAIYEKTDG